MKTGYLYEVSLDGDEVAPGVGLVFALNKKAAIHKCDKLWRNYFNMWPFFMRKGVSSHYFIYSSDECVQEFLDELSRCDDY